MAVAPFTKGVVAASLLLAAAGCGVFGPTEGKTCTLIGCNSGLTVHLNAKPTGTYKVEVFAQSPSLQPVYAYECSNASTCQQDIFFPGLIVSHPYVRITTSSGTKIVEIITVNYVTSRPNGPGCDPECRQATVNVDIP
ncbi:MAG: hypothetical protein ABMA00_10850 [Gemmatimonas sp.]